MIYVYISLSLYIYIYKYISIICLYTHVCLCIYIYIHKSHFITACLLKPGAVLLTLQINTNNKNSKRFLNLQMKHHQTRYRNRWNLRQGATPAFVRICATFAARAPDRGDAPMWKPFPSMGGDAKAQSAN